MQLRPYQIEARTQIKEAFKEGHKAVILCMPTGTGKTVSFSDFAQLTVNNYKRVMILCNRSELITQAAEKLKKYGLEPHLIIPGKKIAPANLYLASNDTLRRRHYPEIDLLIIDECHIRAFDPTALYYKNKGVYIIGCTATPVRMGKKFIKEYPTYTGQLADVYDKLIEPIDIEAAISNDYLTPPVTYGAPVDLSEIGKRGGDYDPKQLYNKFNKPKMYADAVGKYLQFAKGLKTICYNINVDHSKNMALEFQKNGIAARHVDGTTPPAERKKILADFEAGFFKVLCNCDVLTFGLDVPSVQAILVNRSTTSLALWLQICGRGGRPCPEINKNNFVIIDMGNNVFSHGFWQSPQKWDLKLKKVKRESGPAPIKSCIHCQALIPQNAHTCNYCNKPVITDEQKKKVLLEANFIKLDQAPKELKNKAVYEMTIKELIEYQEYKKYSPLWVTRQLYTRPVADLKEYCEIKGYNRAWVFKQLQYIDEQRTNIKALVRKFIEQNPKATPEIVDQHARSRLKEFYPKDELNTLMLKILEYKSIFDESRV